MRSQRALKWMAVVGAIWSWAAASAEAQSPFSIVLLPDTQNYSEKSSYGVYAHQTQWIVNNRAQRNIQFAVHLGDVTNHDTAVEWNVASAAHATLDNASLPYSITNGNHDLFPSSQLHLRQSMFSQYFGPQRFQGKSWYGGAFDASNENNYFLFQTGSLKFLVLSVEFVPRKDVVSWANQVIRNHPDRRVIVATHCHSNRDGDHATGCADGYNVEGREAVDLWEELGQRHSNIFLMVSGHIQGVSYRQRTGLAGNVVHEILTDYQSEPVRGTGTALGNGWLRVLNFDPAQNRISVESLSVEAGNFSIFANGTPELYLPYNQIASPTSTRHNLQNYTVSYDMQTASNNAYAVGDVLFRDRLAHTALSGTHFDPRVAAAPNGNFVAVWEDDSDGNAVGQIHARAFDKDGNALFAEKVVNSIGSGQQQQPDVAMDDQGNFVVVWEDDQDNDGKSQIMARGFLANGSQRFADLTVNSVAGGHHRKPAVAAAAAGNFVVTWEDDQDDNGYYQVLARGFTATGANRIATFTVNSVSGGQQLHPAIGMDGPGNFVIAWEDDQESDGLLQVYARGFAATGAARIADFRVNTGTTGTHMSPSLALDQDGDFVVAWEDDTDNNGSFQVLGRGFSSAGAQRIAQFTVNTVSGGQQYAPALGMDASGDFAVAWEDDQDNNGSFQVLARTFTASGAQRRADFTVNSDSSGQQYVPSSAMDEQNRFVVGWQDDMDGDGSFSILTRNLSW